MLAVSTVDSYGLLVIASSTTGQDRCSEREERDDSALGMHLHEDEVEENLSLPSLYVEGVSIIICGDVENVQCNNVDRGVPNNVGSSKSSFWMRLDFSACSHSR